MEEYLSRWDALWLVLSNMFDKVTIFGTIIGIGIMFFGIVAYFAKKFPPRTFESVVIDLYNGLKDGSIVLEKEKNLEEED